MSEPWYQEGLRFECSRCGNCCTGEPGYVWVNPAEIDAIAQFLGEDLNQTIRLYTKQSQGRLTLKEKINGDCVFFEKNKGCTVYAVRPRQCRTWPFWESNVRTPAAWERTKAICPGSGTGELISAEEITARLKVIRL